MSVYAKLVHVAGVFTPCKCCGAEYETPAIPGRVLCAICGHRADVEFCACDCGRCQATAEAIMDDRDWRRRRELRA